MFLLTSAPLQCIDLHPNCSFLSAQFRNSSQYIPSTPICQYEQILLQCFLFCGVCEVETDFFSGYGGAISLWDSNILISGIKVISNGAGNGGAGIAIWSILDTDIIDSIFAGNYFFSQWENCDGGAIYVTGSYNSSTVVNINNVHFNNHTGIHSFIHLFIQLRYYFHIYEFALLCSTIPLFSILCNLFSVLCILYFSPCWWRYYSRSRL